MKTSFITNSMGISGKYKFRHIILSLIIRLPVVVAVATDYFTKWAEVIPLKTMISQNMIDFVQKHIIYWFGIRRTITTDQGVMFISEEFENFATNTGFKLLNSSPYCA